MKLRTEIQMHTTVNLGGYLAREDVEYLVFQCVSAPGLPPTDNVQDVSSRLHIRLPPYSHWFQQQY